MWTQKQKTLVATIAAVASIGLAAGMYFSQRPTSAATGPTELTLHPERQGEIAAMRRAEGIAERLNLTPEQTREVAAIMQGVREEVVALRQTPSDGNMMTRMQARREMMERAGSQIRTVLTPEQQVEFDAMRANLMENAAMLRQTFGVPGPGGAASGETAP